VAMRSTRATRRRRRPPTRGDALDASSAPAPASANSADALDASSARQPASAPGARTAWPVMRSAFRVEPAGRRRTEASCAMTSAMRVVRVVKAHRETSAVGSQ
jgi:hypothetical protein